MRPQLRWRPRARLDLLEIYEVIALDKPLAAERWLMRIEERVAMLVAHPRLGVRRQELEPAARVMTVGNYLIMYRTHPDTDDEAVDEVEIARVLPAQRDLSRGL